MPWFEARFSDLQRVGWNAAEALAGIKHATTRTPKKAASKAGSRKEGPLAFEDGFAPCENFRGSQEGHCYRQGHRGLGYYKDEQEAPPQEQPKGDENARPTDESAEASTSRATPGAREPER